MTIVSRLFFLWIPSISRPNPGTFAVRLDNPPDEPVSELRCPVKEFFVSKAWLQKYFEYESFMQTRTIQIRCQGSPDYVIDALHRRSNASLFSQQLSDWRILRVVFARVSRRLQELHTVSLALDCSLCSTKNEHKISLDLICWYNRLAHRGVFEFCTIIKVNFVISLN